MATKPEEYTDPEELFVVFEGEQPGGTFITAFSQERMAQDFVNARMKRYTCYHLRYVLYKAPASGT